MGINKCYAYNVSVQLVKMEMLLCQLYMYSYLLLFGYSSNNIMSVIIINNSDDVFM